MFLGDHPYVTDAIASDIVAGGVDVGREFVQGC